jgi:hypothetical protein
MRTVLALVLIVVGFIIAPSAELRVGAGGEWPAWDDGHRSGLDGADSCYIVGDYQDDACLPMPGAMSSGVTAVWLGCEVNGITRDFTHVESASNWGQAQLAAIHRRAMARYDLDFDSEYDRVQYAIALWTWHGWTSWPHCGKLARP